MPPDRAFLRLHSLYEFGDSLGQYRQGSRDAIAKGKSYHLTTGPDKTANDVGKSNAMAKSTFDKLAAARAKSGTSSPKLDWKKIEKAVNRFNAAKSQKTKYEALQKIQKLVREKKE